MNIKSNQLPGIDASWIAVEGKEQIILHKTSNGQLDEKIKLVTKILLTFYHWKKDWALPVIKMPGRYVY